MSEQNQASNEAGASSEIQSIMETGGAGEGQQQSQDGGQQQQQQGEGEQQRASQSASMTPEQLQAVVAGAVKSVMPQQQQGQQQASMTEEEVQKALNVFRFNPELHKQMFNPEIPEEQRVGMFQQVFDSVVKQAVTMAAYQSYIQQQQLAQRLSPLESHFRQVQDEKLKVEFFDKNPDLKDDEELLLTIKNNLLSQGFKGTKEDAFKAIAESARGIKVKINGGGSNQQTQQQQVQRTSTGGKPRMSTLSSGGQGGAGGGGTAATNNPVKELFG